MGIMWHKQVTKNKACGSHVGDLGKTLKWVVCIHSKEEGHNDVKGKRPKVKAAMSQNKQSRPKNYKQATHSQIITLTSLMESQETIKMMESCTKHDYRSFESNSSRHTHTQ